MMLLTVFIFLISPFILLYLLFRTLFFKAKQRLTQPPMDMQFLHSSEVPQSPAAPPRSVVRQDTPLTATARMQLYLTMFEQNRDPTGGIAFKPALQALNLDYTVASLDRLDQCLTHIRNTYKPVYDAYLDQVDQQNFMMLCAAYLSTTIARVTGMPLKWYEYQEARQQLKQVSLPARYETFVTCMIGEQFHMPLGVITEMLFDPNPTLSCRSSSERFIANAKPILSIPESSVLMADYRITLAADQFDALTAMGKLAAYMLFMIESSSGISPQLLMPNGENVVFKAYEGAQGLERGMQDLEQGLEDQPYLVLAYDGYINLATGRLDAITLKFKRYGTTPMQVTISVPYRPAEDKLGFAIHRPKLVESTLADSHNPSLFKAFYSGVQAFRLPDDFWMSSLDERI